MTHSPIPEPDRADEGRELDPHLNDDVVHIVRQTVRDGLGFNTTFVDDDMGVLVSLAQRAVLAGLATDFSKDMRRRFSEAAEPHRAAHEQVLGFALSRVSSEPGWRTIDSAPKDGTYVLIWPGFGDSPYVSQAAWRRQVAPPAKAEMGRERWRPYPSSEIDDREYGAPTHWMPLPAPPTVEGS